MTDVEKDGRSVEDIEQEDPGELLDPAGGPPDEGLVGIYDGDDPVDLD
jgi:hypothetical protein